MEVATRPRSLTWPLLSITTGILLVVRFGSIWGSPGSATASVGDTANAQRRAWWRRHPQLEPILQSRLPLAYPAGCPLSLAEVTAFEVRRYRRANARLFSNQSVVPVTDDVLRRRHKRLLRESARLRAPPDPRAAPPPPRYTHAKLWSGAIPGDAAVLAVSREVLGSDAMRHVWVSERDRVLFCAVPSVASKTWKAFMRKRAGCGDYADLGLAEEGAGLARLADYAPRDRERLLVRGDFHRVVFVRNPYARAMVTYLNGTENADLDSPAYREFMGRVRGRKLNEHGKEIQALTFNFFLKYVSKQQDNNALDPLFALQTDLCGMPGITYDLVGHYERFDEDVTHILNHLQIDRSEFPTPEELGVAVRSDGGAATRELMAVPKHKMRMQKIYSKDFEILEYDKEASVW